MTFLMELYSNFSQINIYKNYHNHENNYGNYQVVNFYKSVMHKTIEKLWITISSQNLLNYKINVKHCPR